MSAVRKFTDEQMFRCLKKANGNLHQAARALNCVPSAIGSRLHNMGRRTDEFYTPPTVHEQLAEVRARAGESENAKKLKVALEEIETLNGTINTLTGLDKIVRERSIRPPAIKKYHKDQSVMFAVLSDVHFEQRIDRDKTLGRSEYTPEIATKRLERYYDQIPKLARDVSQRTSVKDVLVHPILGDMINGPIHDSGPGRNWMAPQEAINAILPILCGGIRYLLDSKQFERIVIPCCVGNHARTTQKPESEMRVETSYEWPLYLRMRDHFRDIGEDRVEVVVPVEYFNRIMLPGGDSVLFHHGDAIKYSNGVGGLLIPLQKYVHRHNSAPEVMAKTVDRLGLRPPLFHVLGHFHQYIHSPGIIVNGSVVGVGGYAHSGGFAYTTPKQAVFVLHPDHGMTYTMPIMFEA